MGFFGRKPRISADGNSSLGYIIATLVSCGHREPDIIENYSIAKIEMYIKQAQALKMEQERRDALSSFYGSRADGKEVQSYLRDLERNTRELTLEENT